MMAPQPDDREALLQQEGRCEQRSGRRRRSSCWPGSGPCIPASVVPIMRAAHATYCSAMPRPR